MPGYMKDKKSMTKGSYVKYNKGGYASISDMEKACGSKTVKNTMRQKYEESK
jgi:hypothetical protein